MAQMLASAGANATTAATTSRRLLGTGDNHGLGSGVGTAGQVQDSVSNSIPSVGRWSAVSQLPDMHGKSLQQVLAGLSDKLNSTEQRIAEQKLKGRPVLGFGQ